MSNIDNNLQLITPTKDDYFLTGNPEITFFKTVYRRHTHFASQLKEFNFNTKLNFGLTSSLNLPKYADLLYKVYLKFIIPEVYIPNKLLNNKDNIYNKITFYNNLYDIFKSLYNYNLNSYNLIYELYQNNNNYDDIDNIYRIMNNNTLQFENEDIIIDNITYKKYIYLNQNLNDDNFKNIIELSNNNDIYINNLYTYGHYLATLTMSKNNIQSFLKNQEESIINILNILVNIINTMNSLDNKFIKIINNLNNEYNKNNNYKFAWVKYLGHNLINYIEIKIGEDVIDRLYGQWINIWWNLTSNKNHIDNYFNLIGNIDILTKFNENIKPKTILYVPIPFWFCKNPGLSLPLLSLNYTDIIFKLNLRKFNEVCYSNYKETFLNDYAENNNLNLQCSLIGEFFYLDKDERNKFARSNHEYLIQQVQFDKQLIVPNKNNSIKLNFFHPTKGIIWNMQFYDKLNNDINDNYCNYTVYDNIINSASLMIENELIADDINNNYYYFLQNFEHFNNSCFNDNILSFWFALLPDELQPTGTCNFSNIRNTLLKFNINEDLFNELKENKKNILLNELDNIKKIKNLSYDDELNYLNIINDEVNSLCFVLNLYALNFNVLRIANGFGKLTFK